MRKGRGTDKDWADRICAAHLFFEKVNLESAFPDQFLEIEKVKNEFCGVSIGLEKRVLILSVFFRKWESNISTFVTHVFLAVSWESESWKWILSNFHFSWEQQQSNRLDHIHWFIKF